MFDVFTDTPDPTLYSFIPNQISLHTLNTAVSTQLQKDLQKEVTRYFPKGPNQVADIANPNLLNHAIWYANSNYSKPFPGETKVLYPNEVLRTATTAKPDTD